MKKIISVVLILVMVFTFAACSKGPDVTGKYLCTSYFAWDDNWPGEGEYIILDAGGKGFLNLSSGGDVSSQSDATWKLKGSALSVKSFLFTFEGTIEGDVIKISIMDTPYVFAKEGSESYATLKAEAEANKPASMWDDDYDWGWDDEESSDVPADMLGTYVCTGWDMMKDGNISNPAGEWMELESSSRGTVCIAGNEYPFSWSFDGYDLTIEEDVGVTYKATFENGIITLDTGMLYIFEKGDIPLDSDLPDDEDSFNDIEDGAFVNTTTEIGYPSRWYGFLMIPDQEYMGDVWAMFDYSSDGYPYFEVYEDMQLNYSEYDAILSMYVFEDSQFVKPDIGEEDAWFYDMDLTADDTAAYTAALYDGALYFSIIYIAEDGTPVDVVIMLREDGHLWNEGLELIPPGYAEYKANVTSYG